MRDQNEQSSNNEEKSSSLSSFLERIDIACLSVIILSAIFPLLALGVYFRNEDAKYILWLKNNLSILDAFNLNVRYHPFTFRPISEIALRIIYRTSGNNPLAFQVISCLLFICAMIFFYKIAKLLFDNKNIAYLSVLAFFANFYFTFHYLYTPISGFQITADMFLVTCALFFLIIDIKRGIISHNFWIAIVLIMLAIFNHPVGAFLLPLLGIIFMIINWNEFKNIGTIKKSLILLLFASLWLTIPVVSKQGDAQLLGISAPFGLIAMLYKDYIAYNVIYLRGFNKYLITIPLFFALSKYIIVKFTPRSSDATLAILLYSSISIIIGLILVSFLPLRSSFIMLSIILLILCVLTDKLILFLVIWYFGGILPHLFSPVVTGTYVRHSAMALSMILGLYYWEIISFVLDLTKERISNITRYVTLNRVAIVITVVAVTLVLVSRFDIVKVPIISKQITQLDYFKSMGKNFEDLLIFLSDNLDENANIYILKGQKRTDQNIYAYIEKHLERLPPAKYQNYTHYFEVYDRRDITIKPAEELLDGTDEVNGDTIILVATNNWEVKHLESKLSLEVWKTFQRGNAIARVYQYKRQ